MSPYVPLDGDAVVGSDASATAATATSPILHDGDQHAQEPLHRPAEENASAESGEIEERDLLMQDSGQMKERLLSILPDTEHSTPLSSLSKEISSSNKTIAGNNSNGPTLANGSKGSRPKLKLTIMNLSGINLRSNADMYSHRLGDLANDSLKGCPTVMVQQQRNNISVTASVSFTGSCDQDDMRVVSSSLCSITERLCVESCPVVIPDGMEDGLVAVWDDDSPFVPDIDSSKGRIMAVPNAKPHLFVTLPERPEQFLCKSISSDLHPDTGSTVASRDSASEIVNNNRTLNVHINSSQSGDSEGLTSCVSGDPCDTNKATSSYSAMDVDDINMRINCSNLPEHSSDEAFGGNRDGQARPQHHNLIGQPKSQRHQQQRSQKKSLRKSSNLHELPELDETDISSISGDGDYNKDQEQLQTQISPLHHETNSNSTTSSSDMESRKNTDTNQSKIGDDKVVATHNAQAISINQNTSNVEIARSMEKSSSSLPEIIEMHLSLNVHSIPTSFSDYNPKCVSSKNDDFSDTSFKNQDDVFIEDTCNAQSACVPSGEGGGAVAHLVLFPDDALFKSRSKTKMNSSDDNAKLDDTFTCHEEQEECRILSLPVRKRTIPLTRGLSMRSSNSFMSSSSHLNLRSRRRGRYGSTSSGTYFYHSPDVWVDIDEDATITVKLERVTEEDELELEKAENEDDNMIPPIPNVTTSSSFFEGSQDKNVGAKEGKEDIHQRGSSEEKHWRNVDGSNRLKEQLQMQIHQFSIQKMSTLGNSISDLGLHLNEQDDEAGQQRHQPHQHSSGGEVENGDDGASQKPQVMEEENMCDDGISSSGNGKEASLCGEENGDDGSVLYGKRLCKRFHRKVQQEQQQTEPIFCDGGLNLEAILNTLSSMVVHCGDEVNGVHMDSGSMESTINTAATLNML